LLQTVQGGKIEVGAPTGKWQMIVVYRGKHDPVSRNYLASLQQCVFELDELGVEVLAVTADGREKAEGFLETLRATTPTKEVNFRIAYGLTITDMNRWGLYISYPRNVRETDAPFPEPAMLLINPEGELHTVEYSNSPFARPDLRIMIEGIRYIEENDYPPRGTYGF
jgi:alkyl hydroperoxide reductase subunit AhpC